MRLVTVLVFLFALVGCSKPPPEYASKVNTPTATTTPAGPQASFVDDFARPNAQGLGDGWDVRGPYAGSFPLPPATDGFLRDGAYSYAGDDVVYAVRQFPVPVTRMGTSGRWTTIRPGAETTMTMAITANDKIVSDMVHFGVSRSIWELKVRRGQGFEPVASGKFTPALKLNTDYRFELEAHDGTVTVRVPGAEEIMPVDLMGIVGDRAFWEEYPATMPGGTVFDYDTVWADY
jgi:hypothetical protein